MGQLPGPSKTALAAALLDVLPRLLRRLRADLPLDAETVAAHPGWRDIAELRATAGQLTLLRVLIEQERCTMQELADHLGVAPSTVTAMVKRLLAHGSIERSRDADDWRAVWVKPTERGRQAIAIYDHARRTFLARRLDHLSEEERHALGAALPVLLHLTEIDS